MGKQYLRPEVGELLDQHVTQNQLWGLDANLIKIAIKFLSALEPLAILRTFNVRQESSVLTVSPVQLPDRERDIALLHAVDIKPFYNMLSGHIHTVFNCLTSENID
jgi:hypothetical protein